MSEKPSSICDVCYLVLPDDGTHHPTHLDCVHALRDTLLRQRKAAETLSFEVSTRYLAILEKMAAETFESGEMVAEVMDQLRRGFYEMGDWSPLKKLQDENAGLRSALEAIEMLSDA